MSLVHEVDLTAIDCTQARQIRDVFGQFATGVTVITTQTAEGKKIGMTANSFSSLSLDPPLVLWSLSKTAPSITAFSKASHFAIHILSAEQQAISQHFARGAEDKFATIAHETCEQGVPILNEALTTLLCKNIQQYEGGDHLIFIGELTHTRQQEGEPLLFHRGQYALKQTADIEEKCA